MIERLFNYCLSCLDFSVLSKYETTAEAPVNAKKLKIGTKLTAKVHQVRAPGLVFDCGGELRGMYRFEVKRQSYLLMVLSWAISRLF